MNEAHGPLARQSGLLRWAGSKRNMLDVLRVRVPRAANRYFEPFAGSACLFFDAAPKSAVLADRNVDLIATYRTLRHRPRAVASRVHGWSTDEQTYYRVRSIMPAELDAVGRAARFIYLNRLCFNGIYRTNRQGTFNVPYGKKTGKIPGENAFAACAAALRTAQLRAGDFEATTLDAGMGDVVYLDPPYTQKAHNAYGVYGYGSFQLPDLERLARHMNLLDQNGATIVLSYADTPMLRDLLDERWTVNQVSGYSHIAARSSARRERPEVLVTNRPDAWTTRL